MKADLVLRTMEDRLVTLTLNRPDKLNALNVAVFEALAVHLDWIEGQGEKVGCIVLRGAGRCFSAGHDLADLEEGEVLPSPNFQARIIERLAKMPVPVITAVHSHCYTGALELALAGDIILASANAKFADTHGKWALVPIWGLSQRLPRRVGQAKAREMMFTCATYKADEALAMGLANRVYPDDVFFDEVTAFARAILANADHSNRANKALLDETEHMGLDAGLAHEIYGSRGFGAEMESRIAAFMKK